MVYIPCQGGLMTMSACIYQSIIALLYSSLSLTNAMYRLLLVSG